MRELRPALIVSAIAIAGFIAITGLCLWMGARAWGAECHLGLQPGDRFDFFEPIGFPPEYTIEITIPDSARNLGSQCYNVQDHATWLWFDMDPGDLDAFIEQAGIEEVSEDSSNIPGFGPEPRGGQDAQYMFGSRGCDFTEARCYLVIWVEITDPEVYRAYIHFGFGS
jgi:hypothetical protein